MILGKEPSAVLSHAINGNEQGDPCTQIDGKQFLPVGGHADEAKGVSRVGSDLHHVFGILEVGISGVQLLRVQDLPVVRADDLPLHDTPGQGPDDAKMKKRCFGVRGGWHQATCGERSQLSAPGRIKAGWC